MEITYQIYAVKLSLANTIKTIDIPSWAKRYGYETFEEAESQLEININSKVYLGHVDHYFIQKIYSHD